jgi:hypothetical protein
MATHQAFHRQRVEGFSKKLEIVLLLLLKTQLPLKTTQGHIGDGKKVSEDNPETLFQFTVKVFFEDRLRRREKRTSRIVNEVQGQNRFSTITQPV